MTHPVSSKQRPAKTTAAMIAEATGFARSTVSHVLNGRAAEMRISKKTTRLILNAANRYGYVAPSTNAAIWRAQGLHEMS